MKNTPRELNVQRGTLLSACLGEIIKLNSQPYLEPLGGDTRRSTIPQHLGVLLFCLIITDSLVTLWSLTCGCIVGIKHTGWFTGWETLSADTFSKATLVLLPLKGKYKLFFYYLCLNSKTTKDVMFKSQQSSRLKLVLSFWSSRTETCFHFATEAKWLTPALIFCSWNDEMMIDEAIQLKEAKADASSHGKVLPDFWS